MAKQAKVIDVLKTTDRGYNVKKLRMDNAMLDEEMRKFEKGFPDGVYAAPQPSEPIIKVRAMLDYCNENGKKPEDLTREELKQFYMN